MISIVIRLLWIWSEPALIKAEWTCINKVRVTSTVTSVGSLLFLSTSISCRTGHRQLSQCFWFLRPGSDDLSGDWRLTYRKDYYKHMLLQWLCASLALTLLLAPGSSSYFFPVKTSSSTPPADSFSSLGTRNTLRPPVWLLQWCISFPVFMGDTLLSIRPSTCPSNVCCSQLCQQTREGDAVLSSWSENTS